MTAEMLIIDALLLLMCVVVAVLAFNRDLFTIVILAGVYSFLMGAVLVALDAVDVAMTEASVGAGISTVLMLGALALCRKDEARPVRRRLIPLLAAASAIGLLVYGTFELPEFNNPQAPIHRHVAPEYLKEAPVETGVPNVVTAVLASYRSYDTLGETTVVFTAGVGVIALLRGARRRGRP